MQQIRAEARALTRELFAKLDALSHFQYAPKPVIEDLAVRADLPALAMEEVAPQVCVLRLSCIQRYALWLSHCLPRVQGSSSSARGEGSCKTALAVEEVAPQV